MTRSKGTKLSLPAVRQGRERTRAEKDSTQVIAPTLRSIRRLRAAINLVTPDMSQALLHGGPGGNLLVNVTGTPETLEFQPAPIISTHVVQVHPKPIETTQVTQVPVVLYHKVRKIVPDGLLHYLFMGDYQKLVSGRGF